ncbi:MAG: hypothetical protein R3362_11495 [Rhodothermales bacterium]|nr:hypothetical protein [Rhodothermales bacterium]
MARLFVSASGFSPGRFALRPLLAAALLAVLPGCDLWDYSGEEEGPYTPRPVLDVTWNAEFTVVNISYEAEGCEGGEGDTCDIDAVTLICSPGAEGTIESCDVSN